MSRGLAQLPVIFVLVLLAISVPALSLLVTNKTFDNRSRADYNVRPTPTAACIPNVSCGATTLIGNYCSDGCGHLVPGRMAAVTPTRIPGVTCSGQCQSLTCVQLGRQTASGSCPVGQYCCGGGVPLAASPTPTRLPVACMLPDHRPNGCACDWGVSCESGWCQYGRCATRVIPMVTPMPTRIPECQGYLRVECYGSDAVRVCGSDGRWRYQECAGELKCDSKVNRCVQLTAMNAFPTATVTLSIQPTPARIPVPTATPTVKWAGISCLVDGYLCGRDGSCSQCCHNSYGVGSGRTCGPVPTVAPYKRTGRGCGDVSSAGWGECWVGGCGNGTNQLGGGNWGCLAEEVCCVSRQEPVVEGKSCGQSETYGVGQCRVTCRSGEISMGNDCGPIKCCVSENTACIVAGTGKKKNTCPCGSSNECLSGNCDEGHRCADFKPVATPTVFNRDPRCQGSDGTLLSSGRLDGCVCEVGSQCAGGVCWNKTCSSNKCLVENGKPNGCSCDRNAECQTNICGGWLVGCSSSPVWLIWSKVSAITSMITSALSW